MGTTVDSLDIDIAAQASKANKSLDALVTRLDKITSSLNRAGGTGMAQMAVGVERLARAMQTMNTVGTADFTRLAKNMEKMGTIDSGKVRNTAVAISGLTRALSSLQTTSGSEAAKQISELATGISRLGYKSANQAIKNIPELAKSMKDLMTTLSGAPKVSQNLIDMTNALANLARTGASSGRAANSLSKSLNTYSVSAKKAKSHTFSLSSALGKMYATYWLLFRAFGALGDAIDISSSLTEVQNVVDQTFGEYSHLVEEMASTSIQDFGMSELTVKQISSRFQAMGTAMGFAQGKMADMSLTLTGLAGDMASFYNTEQSDVAKSLQSIFTGETEPMRKYGIDLTNATIQQWALNNGMKANVSTMTQMEKAMLRYEYVMAHTQSSQGDFARTINSWANQTRILKQNFQQLGGVIGGTFINALTPFVKALNFVMAKVIAFAETVSNALGKIFGWQFQKTGGGSVDDLSGGIGDVSDAAGGAADNLGGATDAAKKLKRELLGFDEINKLSDITDPNSGSGGSGGGGGGAAGASDGAGGEWTQVETVWDSFESEIDTLYELGDYIGKTLRKTLEKINWNSVYKSASAFGAGLANFLNGLISPQLFGTLGGTVAGAINTALHGLNSFGETFNWKGFGYSIANGINKFFRETDFRLSADTVNTWAHGILDSIIAGISGTNWELVGYQVAQFLQKIDWIGLLKKVGIALWEAFKGAIKLTDTIFDGAGIETKIVAVLTGLKFLSIGTMLGAKVWTRIKESILGKIVSSVFSKIIGTGVSESVSKGIEKEISTIRPNLTGLKTGLTESLKALGPAVGQAAVYTGIAQLGVEMQKVVDVARGGNGYLSEFGGVLDSIGNTFAPEASDSLFELKEELEDTGANTETIVGRLVEFFNGKGISSEMLRTKFNEVGGEINTTAEQAEIMNAVIGQLSDTGGMTETSFDKLKDSLVELQQKGVIPGNEQMQSLLGVLDEQYYSGADAKTAWEALTTQMEIMGISVEDVTKNLSEMPTDVDVEIGASTGKFDGKYTSLQKQLKKNGIDVPVITSTTARIFQKALAKKKLGDGAEVEVGVEVGTEEREFQGEISGLTDNFWLDIKTMVGTSSGSMQRMVTDKFRGFTLGINAKANVTEKDTSKLNKNIDGFTGNIEKKTVKGLDMLIGGFTGNIEKKTTDGLSMKISGFTGNIAKKTTDGLNKVISGFTGNIEKKTTTGLNKTIPGVTAKVERLEKKSGLSFSLTAAVSRITSGLSLLFRKDGGVFANGSWHPITAYAGGGLPNVGQMFVAREAGPELVGTIGNHTAVMNNNQIVGSVSDGVYRAVLSAMAQVGGSQKSDVHVYLEGDAAGVFRLVKTENDRIVVATGAPALLT